MNGIKYRSADEMKDSGIQWIGQIPSEWFVERIQHLFRFRTEKVSDKLYEALSVTKNGITKQLDNVAKTDDGDNRKRVMINDFVINSRADRKGSCGVSPYNGSVSLICHVLEHTNRILPMFSNHMLRSNNFSEEFYRWGTGIVDDLWSTNIDRMSKISLPIPCIPEQRKIANFLDIKTAQFDSIIAKKEQLIAKLEEAKKSLISEVVTGKVKIVVGKLVPRQPEEMKDSGVEWLGMIPKEWSVRKFSHIIAIANGQVDPRISPFKEMILIAPNHIESNTGRILNLQSAEDQSADSGKYFCDKGDVIYSKIRPALCKACIAPMDCLTSADMYPMKADKKLLMNEWFLMILLSDNFTSAVILDSDRVAMPKVNRDSLSSYKLPVPSLLEQKSILSLIMTKQFEMDSVLEKTNLQISLLKSAKQSLISEAVTGKIDLRDWEINEQGGAS